MARKHTKKWEALYRSTMQWQGRAQAKQRRLTAKGATNVSEISPVLPARSLQSMSYHELERYRNDLAQFSDRNTSFTILKSGEAVRTGDIRRLKRMVRQINRTRAQQVERLNAPKNVPRAVDLKWKHAERTFIDPITHKPTRPPVGMGSPFAPVRFTELPSSAESMRSLEKSFRRMRARTFEDVARAYRASAVKIANQMNNPELSDQIDDLSDFELVFAAERMGLLEDLAAWYLSVADFESGRAAPSDTDPEGYELMQQSLMERLGDLQSAYIHG